MQIYNFFSRNANKAGVKLLRTLQKGRFPATEMGHPCGCPLAVNLIFRYGKLYSPHTIWSFLNFNIPLFDGLVDKVCDVSGAQFVEESLAMSLNRVFRDKQLFCNLLRGVSLSHGFKDINLSLWGLLFLSFLCAGGQSVVYHSCQDWYLSFVLSCAKIAKNSDSKQTCRAKNQLEIAKLRVTVV